MPGPCMSTCWNRRAVQCDVGLPEIGFFQHEFLVLHDHIASTRCVPFLRKPFVPSGRRSAAIVDISLAELPFRADVQLDKSPPRNAIQAVGGRKRCRHNLKISAIHLFGNSSLAVEQKNPVTAGVKPERLGEESRRILVAEPWNQARRTFRIRPLPGSRLDILRGTGHFNGAGFWPGRLAACGQQHSSDNQCDQSLSDMPHLNLSPPEVHRLYFTGTRPQAAIQKIRTLPFSAMAGQAARGSPTAPRREQRPCIHVRGPASASRPPTPAADPGARRFQGADHPVRVRQPLHPRRRASANPRAWRAVPRPCRTSARRRCHPAINAPAGPCPVGLRQRRCGQGGRHLDAARAGVRTPSRRSSTPRGPCRRCHTSRGTPGGCSSHDRCGTRSPG